MNRLDAITEAVTRTLANRQAEIDDGDLRSVTLRVFINPRTGRLREVMFEKQVVQELS